jgi:hypothetical protein
MRPALHRELVALFGEPVVAHAAITDPTTLHPSAPAMNAVSASADALLKLAGQPDAQRAYVSTLQPDLRLLLCLWIGNTGMVSALTHVRPAESAPTLTTPNCDQWVM